MPPDAGSAAYEPATSRRRLRKFQAAIETEPSGRRFAQQPRAGPRRDESPGRRHPLSSAAVALGPPDSWAYQFNLARALGLVGRMAESIPGLSPCAGTLSRRLRDRVQPGAGAAQDRATRQARSSSTRRQSTCSPTTRRSGRHWAMSYERLQKRQKRQRRTRSTCGCRPQPRMPIQVRARIAELTGASAPPAVPAAAERL